MKYRSEPPIYYPHKYIYLNDFDRAKRKKIIDHYLAGYLVSHWLMYYSQWLWSQIEPFIQEIHDWTIDLGAYCNHEDCY